MASSEFAFLRAGRFFRYDQERFSVGGGLRIPTGLGNGAILDYCYLENRDLPAVHRFSLDIRF